MRAATPLKGRQRSAMRSSLRASGRRLRFRASSRGFLQREIAGGEGVGMAEAEQEENVRRPRAHALDLDQRLVRLLGVDAAETFEIEAAFDDPLAPRRAACGSWRSTTRRRASPPLSPWRFAPPRAGRCAPATGRRWRSRWRSTPAARRRSRRAPQSPLPCGEAAGGRRSRSGDRSAPDPWRAGARPPRSTPPRRRSGGPDGRPASWVRGRAGLPARRA